MSRSSRSMHGTIKPPRSRCTTAICFSWKVFTVFLSHMTLVGLVIGYCIAGAAIFQSLEEANEKKVRQNIVDKRNYITDEIWTMTNGKLVLKEDNWTDSVEKHLLNFENDIQSAIKNGWDGKTNGDSQWSFSGSLFYSIIVITTIGYGHIAPRTDGGKVTTIFYAILGIPLMLLCLSNIGDIMASSFRFLYWRVCCFICTRESKKNSFRRSLRGSTRNDYRYSGRMPPLRRSIRNSQRSADSGVAPSYGSGMFHAHSDPELRYTSQRSQSRYRRESLEYPARYGGKAGGGFERNRGADMGRDFNRQRNYDVERGGCETERGCGRDRGCGRSRGCNGEREYEPPYERSNLYSSQPPPNDPPYPYGRMRNREAMQGRHTIERERSVLRSGRFDDEFEIPRKMSQVPRAGRSVSVGREMKGGYAQPVPHYKSRSSARSPYARAKSVDYRSNAYRFDEESCCKTPVLCNQYVIEEPLQNEPYIGRRRESMKPRSQSMPRQQQYIDDRLEMQQFQQPAPRRGQYYRYDEKVNGNIDTRSMPTRPQRGGSYQLRERQSTALPPSPRIMSPMGYTVLRQTNMTVYEDDSMDEDFDYKGDMPHQNQPVPIWLCVLLVISYILGGALIFQHWEGWEYLDSAYFCFITLTTIGFGDFVPAQNRKNGDVPDTIALCSLYLLFGISLLAMSFNLVQEEFISNVKSIARRLGIIKKEDSEDER